MQNSKLYSVLGYFDKYDLNRLRKFLHSPFFNRNGSLVGLFEVLAAHRNGPPEEPLEKNRIWAELMPGQSFDDVLFRKYCSDLLKLIETFLAQQVYEENSVYQASCLIDAVAKRKLEPLFNSTVRTARRLSGQQTYRTAAYYLSQYQVEKNFFNLEELRHDRTAKRNVEDILNHLDRFYLSEKLRYACYVFSQQSLVSHEYQLLFMEEIVRHVERHDFEDVPPVSIYYQIYLTYVDAENTDHYFRLTGLLERFGDLFPRQEAEFIYTTALNYCIRKLNQGSHQFLEEYFNVFVILLDKELLHTDGELSPWHFRNIVSIALRLGKYDWTDRFIQDYQRHLPAAMRENAVSFNLALLHFYQKNHSKVIELLRSVEYDDPSYNLNSKSMLLQTYYELDEIEPMYSLMDTFRTYLNRHKDFPASRRVLYTNLIRFTKQLSKVMPGDQKAVQRLRMEVEEAAETEGVASITWLKEKIAELE
ncbi:MAG: hypothetical protein RLY31_1161 [Bacteroidota bacterium]|jgi:hypothetical protein